MKTLTNFIKENLDGTSELIYHITRIWEDIENNGFADNISMLRGDIGAWISELEGAWSDDKYAILGDESTDPKYNKEFKKFKVVEKKIDKAVENVVKVLKEFDKEVVRKGVNDDELIEEYYNKIDEVFDGVMTYKDDLYYWYQQLNKLRY